MFVTDWDIQIKHKSIIRLLYSVFFQKVWMLIDIMFDEYVFKMILMNGNLLKLLTTECVTDSFESWEVNSGSYG